MLRPETEKLDPQVAASYPSDRSQIHQNGPVLERHLEAQFQISVYGHDDRTLDATAPGSEVDNRPFFRADEHGSETRSKCDGNPPRRAPLIHTVPLCPWTDRFLTYL